MWFRLGRFEEDMIYRLLFCSLLGTFGVTLLSGGVVCDLLHRLLDEKKRPRTFLWAVLDKVYSIRGLVAAGCLSLPLTIWLIGEGLATRILHGYVDLHWSRIVLAGLIAFGLGQMLITVLIANLLRFHTERKPLLVSQHTAARGETLTAPRTGSQEVSADRDALTAC
jgi:hypothetical protein